MRHFIIAILAFSNLLSLPVWADFQAFEQSIPGTDQSFSMLPIHGGRFAMGSTEDEPGHASAESPRHDVSIADFWMSKHEINWQQYEPFVYRDEAQFKVLAAPAQLQSLAIDGVTGATAPYSDMSFGMGKDGFPVVNATQYAALQYARWLSAKTGRFYRLPTEAEWEYACRAGTTTPWSFGSDPAAASEYAIFSDNSDDRYARTGTRKSNPWGLYDMHGNVAEWTMDQFAQGFYAQSTDDNPWKRPTDLYPRVARGGSWLDDIQELRCAARLPSSPAWKERDPQMPKSKWWLTNAPFVGIRLVSPRVQPSTERVNQYWLEAIEDYGI